VNAAPAAELTVTSRRPQISEADKLRSRRRSGGDDRGGHGLGRRGHGHGLR